MSKKRLFISLAMIIIGLCMTFYSFLVNKANEKHSSQIINEYNEVVKNTKQSKIDKLIREAEKYNASLVDTDVVITDPFKVAGKHKRTLKDYDKILKLNNNSLLCYVEIPCIDVYLPSFHGTADDTLLRGAGHIEGTSIPVGGKSTHSVIAAHSGLSTAKMFTDLEKMTFGDIFYIHFLGKTNCYKVDKITVVEPDDVSQLYIEKDKDWQMN